MTGCPQTFDVFMGVFFCQDTLICVSESGPDPGQKVYISTQDQGGDVTHTLATHSPEDTQRWNDALWQHVYNMSKACVNQIVIAVVKTPTVPSTLQVSG